MSLGILEPKDGRLEPKGKVTRAEMAEVLVALQDHLDYRRYNTPEW